MKRGRGRPPGRGPIQADLLRLLDKLEATAEAPVPLAVLVRYAQNHGHDRTATYKRIGKLRALGVVDVIRQDGLFGSRGTIMIYRRGIEDGQ